MSDNETAPEMLARLGTDAMLWAQEFNKTAVRLGYSEMDEGWLIGWFASAIENCDMIRCNRIRAELATVTAERDRLLNNNEKMLVQIEKLVEENNEWHSAANWPDKSPRALRLESANLWEKNKELREENERLREALKDALVWLGDPHGGRPVMSVDSIRNIAARAALEGVPEPPR